jgi:hypothetical protein
MSSRSETSPLQQPISRAAQRTFGISGQIVHVSSHRELVSTMFALMIVKLAFLLAPTRASKAQHHPGAWKAGRESRTESARLGPAQSRPILESEALRPRPGTPLLCRTEVTVEMSFVDAHAVRGRFLVARIRDLENRRAREPSGL